MSLLAYLIRDWVFMQLSFAIFASTLVIFYFLVKQMHFLKCMSRNMSFYSFSGSRIPKVALTEFLFRRGEGGL